MPDSSSFDTKHAHKFFSSYCFNYAWELMEKSERDTEENEQMIQEEAIGRPDGRWLDERANRSRGNCRCSAE